MSSKYRRKQLKRRKKVADEEDILETEWDALHVLALDPEIEAEYDSEIFIPHDHLSERTLRAVDFLVKKGYTPLPISEMPMGTTTTQYLRGSK